MWLRGSRGVEGLKGVLIMEIKDFLCGFSAAVAGCLRKCVASAGQLLLLPLDESFHLVLSFHPPLLWEI